MSAAPCRNCGAYTTNEKTPAGNRLCDPCLNRLEFVKQQPVDDLRELVASPGLPTTCAWLEDRCDRPAVGDAAHVVHGVIPICRQHHDATGVDLITTYEGATA